MAEVYRARGKGADGRTWLYAVKRILPELTQDPTLRSMFVEEARIASMLVHPNVVRVYDLARGENDDYYIVMEFLEGRDLAETIDKASDERRPLPIWLCIHAAREVCKALIYATSQALDREGRPLGLIHRDISPHNIFVCFDGQVKLTDFGVAKVAQSNVLTQVGVTKGKFGYMSPEQLLSEKLDFRSDLFNVGILLYETLTGRRLFYGDNPSQFLQAMLRAEVPRLDAQLGVPAELEALIRRALTREREDRPATAQQFEDELRAIAERYGLLASREHVSNEIRAIFGSEIESCPVPQQKPATAIKLASVSAALPAAVMRVPSQVVAVSPEQVLESVSIATPPSVRSALQRVPVSSAPSAQQPASAQQIVPTQAKTRGLSDPSAELASQVRASVDSVGRPAADRARERPRTRPQGPSLASATGSGSTERASSSMPRQGTSSVRPLPEEMVTPHEDPRTMPPDTVPPDSEKTGPGRQIPRRKPTVIVVGGAGAKPLKEQPSRDEGDWNDATSTSGDSFNVKPSVVTRSPRVVPLPSSKKK